MITRPQPGDIPRLKEMWKNIFGDSDNMIDCFFAVLFEDKNALVWKDNDIIVAMLYMIPYRHGSYLYALGTMPDYRKQGIMSKLIDRACDIQKKAGSKGMFLVPASEKMDKYYEKFGFVKTDFEELNRLDMSLDDYETRIKQYVEYLELHENDGNKFVPEYFHVKSFDGFDINKICGYIPF